MTPNQAQAVANTLGILSVGSGLLLLLVPRSVARAYALPSRPTAFVRSLGVRDIAIGALLLTSAWRRRACLARALSDAADAALIAARGARGGMNASTLGRVAIALTASSIGFSAVHHLAESSTRPVQP